MDVVEDGEHGFERALAASYEFVILDLMLPGRNGLDALRELHRQRPALPVVILSARATSRPSSEASSSAPSTTWPSRSRSTSCWPGRACSYGARARPMTGP